MEITAFDRDMAIVAFAEEGDFKSAKDMMGHRGATAPAPKKSKGNVLKAAVWGTCSAALFYGIFSNEALVTELYTKGGSYAALPIVTVFLFSFIHGAFSNYLLSACGLEAKKK